MTTDGENGKVLAPPERAQTGLYVRASKGLKLRDRKTERLARKVRAVLPWLEPSDYPAVRAWCELEYLAGQVYAVLRAGSVVNAVGEGKRLLDDYRKLRLAQAVYSRELGMTPAARMALKASGTRAAFDLPSAMSEAEKADTGSPEDPSETIRPNGARSADKPGKSVRIGWCAGIAATRPTWGGCGPTTGRKSG